MVVPTTAPDEISPDETPSDETATVAAAVSTEVLHGLDEDDQPRRRWEFVVGWCIVAACTLAVFYVIDPNLKLWPLWDIRFGDVFKNTTANGGDMGAHVWWPKFLADNWFPKGRLSGWAPDWYAGFPVGQYYFPVPAVMVWIFNVILPYNVAFKLVTISGPMMLPAAAYYFARGLRTPWPAPPAFAIASLGLLMQTRNEWQIYGGNIASTLAGEFSFTIGLAFALFALGALAKTLDTGRKPWLPALLISLAIMSHIVVAIFMAITATLLWLTRRPFRTWRLAIPVGIVGLALTAVWTVPLWFAQGYTQSMRYTKLQVRGGWELPSWLWLPGPIKHTIEGVWNGLSRPPIDTNTNPPRHFSPTLWLPWWIWLLAGVAIVAAGYYRRRSTLVLLILAAVFGIMFIEWPEHAIWNTRFLPFWLLSWAFLAAMGATEICRLLAKLVARAYTWIREGDLQDARARAWAELATADPADETIDPDARKDAAWALAERRFDRGPTDWEPPEKLAPGRIKRHGLLIGSAAMSVLVLLLGLFAINRAWDARDNNPSIQPRGWAAWNYSGYEAKTTYPQYKAIMDGMEEIADSPSGGPGRALWEPSAIEGDPINAYGTSLALELLPHFTDGKIGSMEGIYFESSGTTSFHFLMVADCSAHPSNPVRALVYGNPTDDFDLCIEQMQQLGVRYFMVWTPEVRELADKNDDLTFIKEIPGEIPGTDLKGWRIYEVADSDLVEGLTKEPVVVNTHAGKYSDCWRQPWPDPNTPEARLDHGWECTIAPAWVDRDLISTPFADEGGSGLKSKLNGLVTGAPKTPPNEWQRVDGRDLASAKPRTIEDPAVVSNVERDVDSIEFDVDQIGKPVVVKESFYPNWQVSGAKGPYRLSPNVMVVVPTASHVKLTYGLTNGDNLGRVISIMGLVGLVLLFLWKGARRYSAGATDSSEDDNGSTDSGDAEASDDDSNGGGIPDSDGHDNGPPGESESPPDTEKPWGWEPEPALP